jgi:prepilin-type N-terminal cleavage/methylation domain-containing protein/prepilin-type processing-associated H-X9-DG protein
MLRPAAYPLTMQSPPDLQGQHALPPRSHGYTLIELLVVIAIIAVLAAIAFPGYLSMVENSRTAQCTSNLREIFTGIQGYVQDNNGQYPLARRGGSIKDLWFVAIGPYLSEGRRFDQSKVDSLSGPWPQNTPFACPSCTNHGWKPGSAPNGAGTDMGINAFQVGGPDAAYPPPPLRASRVTAPSTTMLVADAITGTGSGSWSIGWRLGANNQNMGFDEVSIDTRHKRRANVLYFDGHVGQVTAKQLQDRDFVEKLRGP